MYVDIYGTKKQRSKEHIRMHVWNSSTTSQCGILQSWIAVLQTVLTEWHFFPHIINFFVCEAFPIMRSGNNILLYIIGFV
jgi:hypothetical protein